MWELSARIISRYVKGIGGGGGEGRSSGGCDTKQRRAQNWLSITTAGKIKEKSGKGDLMLEVESCAIITHVREQQELDGT